MGRGDEDGAFILFARLAGWKLPGACGPSAPGRRDGENSVTLTAASGDESAAFATLPTWGVVSTSLPTWRVASQIRGLAWRSEPARLEPARRSEPPRLEPARQARAARLPEGAQAPRGPGTRRHRHTRQSLRAQQPTPQGGAQARGSTRPCRIRKRARRAEHRHPPSRPRGRPVLPKPSVRAAQHPAARALRPQPAGTRSVPALGVDARSPFQHRARTLARATRSGLLVRIAARRPRRRRRPTARSRPVLGRERPSRPPRASRERSIVARRLTLGAHLSARRARGGSRL